LHYQPQQSVLNPQFGHRQTACIRYISAWPHRSQITLSSAAGAVVFSGEIGRTTLRGSSGDVGSDMAAIIADALSASLDAPTRRIESGSEEAHRR